MTKGKYVVKIKDYKELYEFSSLDDEIGLISPQGREVLPRLQQLIKKKRLEVVYGLLIEVEYRDNNNNSFVLPTKNFIVFGIQIKAGGALRLLGQVVDDELVIIGIDRQNLKYVQEYGVAFINKAFKLVFEQPEDFVLLVIDQANFLKLSWKTDQYFAHDLDWG